MTGSFRKFAFALAALSLSAPLALAQDLKETFQQAYDLLARDRKEESLRMFQKVLSMQPTPEQAYELWTSTDHEVWLELMRERGDFELIARRLMALVDAERHARKNDSEAIVALIGQLKTEDPIARRKAIATLGSEHGEYAVPHLLGWLGDTGNEENRITAIQTLQEMNTDVVLPLIEVLDSDDAFLRRNAVMVLAHIGDPRAAGALAWVAASDTDGAVRAAASDALGRMSSSGNACRDLTSLGEAYHLRSSAVLEAYQWSDVVWSWKDGRLVSSETPPALYPDEMAKKAFLRAIKADSGCTDAYSGLARAYAGQVAAVETLAATGTDVAAWQPAADAARVALGLVGPAALDAGLARSLGQNDVATAVVLVRTLAEVAPAPTSAMQSALRAGDGAISSEAAVALGHMSTWGKSRASSELVGALGAVAGREIVRLAFVIDADAARGQRVADALSASGMTINTATSGAIGLATLRRMPGIDAVVVAESLPDLTPHQVIDELRADGAFAKAPIFLVSASPEQAGEAFGETVTGVLADPGDVSAVVAALSESLGAGRERADALAGEAAQTLATLAGTGTDISGATDALAGSLGRTDNVAIGAAYALAAGGNAAHLGALSALIADGARSEGVREAAGHAIASILGRGAAGDEALVGALRQVVGSDAPLVVRTAAAQALGNLPLSAQDRASQLESLDRPQN
jgi:HEAT repeat protein/CheY-like chemotaxis protein